MAKFLATLRSIILFERARSLALKGKYETSLKRLSSVDKIWNASSKQNTVLPVVNLLRIYVLYRLNKLEECQNFTKIVDWQINSKESKFYKIYNNDSKIYIDSYLQIIMNDLGDSLKTDANLEKVRAERKHFDINLVDRFLIRNFPILP
jgi:hypothetical protein